MQADLRQHYREVRARLWGLPPPSQMMLLPPRPAPQPHITEKKITSKSAARQICSRRRSWHRGHLSVSSVMSISALYFNILPGELVHQYRGASIMRCRHITFFLIQEFCNCSLCQMARIVHRDHTTFIHSIRVSKSKIISDEKFAADVAALRKLLIRAGAIPVAPNAGRPECGDATC